MAQNKQKRVWCLYRVSTIGQVDHDDIPMQRDMCHKFTSTHPDWVIENELYEKGVSGFKTSASDREALNMLKEAALSKQFDVLLVFMFDRIGRRTDETPLIMQWFVNQGIEIWSTREGQRKYDTPEDELVGWLGTWLASGESRKTSMRVKASKATMADRGFYTGGYVPYGYNAERIGRVNKKDQPVRDLVINESEAEIIRFIFHAIVELGYGSYIIANSLNARNIPTKRKNAAWRATSIRAIVRNPIYIGMMKTPSGLSGPYEKYQIIDESTFNLASSTMRERAPDMSEERHGALRVANSEHGLLTGIVYCACCGGRLTYNHFIQKRMLADGTLRQYDREVYRCNTRLYNKLACKGRTIHDAITLDAIVHDMVRRFFTMVKKKPKESMLQSAMASENSLLAIAYRQAEKALKKAQKDMAALDEEAIRTLTGEGSYTVEMINRLLPIQQDKLDKAQAEFSRLAAEQGLELERRTKQIAEIDRVLTWAETFEASSFDKKRMIVAAIVEKVAVLDTQHVDITLKLTSRQFLGEDMKNTS